MDTKIPKNKVHKNHRFIRRLNYALSKKISDCQTFLILLTDNRVKKFHKKFNKHFHFPALVYQEEYSSDLFREQHIMDNIDPGDWSYVYFYTSHELNDTDFYLEKNPNLQEKAKIQLTSKLKQNVILFETWIKSNSYSKDEMQQYILQGLQEIGLKDCRYWIDMFYLYFTKGIIESIHSESITISEDTYGDNKNDLLSLRAKGVVKVEFDYIPTKEDVSNKIFEAKYVYAMIPIKQEIITLERKGIPEDDYPDIDIDAYVEKLTKDYRIDIIPKKERADRAIYTQIHDFNNLLYLYKAYLKSGKQYPFLKTARAKSFNQFEEEAKTDKEQTPYGYFVHKLMMANKKDTSRLKQYSAKFELQLREASEFADEMEEAYELTTPGNIFRNYLSLRFSEFNTRIVKEFST